MTERLDLPPRSTASRLAVPATLAVALVIALLCLLPTDGLEAQVYGNDKLHHALAFAALAFPAALLRPSLLRWVLPLGVAYGAAIEVAQFVIGRDASVYDLAADAVGLGLGAVAGFALGRLRPG